MSNYTGAILDRETIATLGAYWKDVRFDYTSGDMDYRGCHYVHGAATDDVYWEIWKYTYDGSSNLVRAEGPLQGAWDNRASLGWGA